MVQKRQYIGRVSIAKPNDLDDITKILNQAINWGNANAYTKELRSEDRYKWFNEHMKGKYAVYVYKEGETVLGYLSIGPYRKGRGAFRNTAEVSYYVDFTHHRKGIVSKLMLKAFEHCKEKEIKTLLAFLYSHNKTSIDFMKRFGFEQWGLFPRTAKSKGKEFDHVVYGKRIE